ncbi:MAG TPA: hypothetical protein VGN89_02780 [Phenylobacterium sp.]|nr:hypothetical protein [Phenylobacterium sp.]
MGSPGFGFWAATVPAGQFDATRARPTVTETSNCDCTSRSAISGDMPNTLGMVSLAARSALSRAWVSACWRARAWAAASAAGSTCAAGECL